VFLTPLSMACLGLCHTLERHTLRRPISPYLFILVAETLSCVISEVAKDRSIHGTKVSKRGLAIPYLVFIHNNLLFARDNQ